MTHANEGDTYPVQIAIGEKTSTTGDDGPAALPATPALVLQRRRIEVALLHWASTFLIREVGAYYHPQAAKDRVVITCATTGPDCISRCRYRVLVLRTRVVWKGEEIEGVSRI
jgi:hypothetical protein